MLNPVTTEKTQSAFTSSTMTHGCVWILRTWKMMITLVLNQKTVLMSWVYPTLLLVLETDPNGGELAQNLNFFAWLDEGATDGFQGQGQDPTEGDNEWQDGPEPPLFSNVIGPASDVLNGVTYTLADSNFSVIGGPFIGSTTYYIGVTWCAGTLSVDVPDVDNDNMTGQPFLDCD